VCSANANEAGEPGDYLIEAASWYTENPESTLEQAQVAEFNPYSGILSKGYVPGATWVRLSIAGLGDTRDQPTLVIRIRPTFLNEITLFDPAQGWVPEYTGDAVRDPRYLVRPTNLGFQIPATEADRDVYLKLVSTSSHILDAQVLSFDRFLQEEGYQTLWHGMFFGVVGLILIWAFFEWFSKRDKLIGRFLTKHVAVTLYCMGYLGYWSYLIPLAPIDFEPDLIFSYSIFLLVFVALRFHVGVLTDYGLAHWPVRLCQAFYAAPLVSLVLALSGRLQAALELMSLVTLLVPIVVLLIISLTSTPTALVSASGGSFSESSTKQREAIGPLSRRTLLIYYGFIFCILGLGATQVLGLFQGNEFVLHAFLFHSVISSILLMTMLLFRARDLQRRQILATQRAASVEGELVAERVAREDQSRLVEMLGHEIKTPLTVLQLAIEEWVQEDQEKKLADRSIDEIRSVVDRSIAGFTDNANDQELTVLDLSALVAEQVQRTQQANRFQCELIADAKVMGSQVLVEQMVTVYLDNALKYGDKHSPIQVLLMPTSHIRFGQPLPGFELRVINTIGCAGSPDPAMVFKRYYRAPGARQVSGTGIGLFLVQTFARIQSGDVHYRPTDKHVEFALWLPA
jgi:signal transduction histidine kinase